MKNHLELLTDGLEQFNLPPDSHVLQCFESYMNMVLLKNTQMNLTAITDLEEFVIKHYIDSLTICRHPILEESQHIIDVGTGGGFPGIPLAIIFPQKKIVLMDSLNKKIVFLQEAIEKLNLTNVTAIHARAEDLGNTEEHRGKYDLCVSRAVAKLSALSEYCLPFVKVGGVFAAYKSANEDLSSGANAIAVLGGNIEEVSPFPKLTGSLSHLSLDHNIVFIRKNKDTPLKYPRKAGLPTKNPL